MTSLAYRIFNPVSFFAAAYRFSKLNHKDYQKEIRRHDLALEKLKKSKELWYENESLRRIEFNN